MYVSLCLILKDENSYLPEWLDYHILLGVEHFWIYDNDSKTPVAETISDYIKRGIVTVNTIHGQGMQLYAYDHCIRTYGEFSKWIGFIDTDEFIVPKTQQSFAEFLVDYESYAGLAISSLFYGSNGNTHRPESGQIAGYLTRTPNEYSMNRLVKSIVQPDKVLFPVSPHNFMFREGNYCVNENNKRVDTQYFPCNIEKIQLNHYFTRSSSEWKLKMSRGRGDQGDPYSDDRWVMVEKNSMVFDDAAVRTIVDRSGLPVQQRKKISRFCEPHSRKLLDLLSTSAKGIELPPFEGVIDPNITKRPELIALLQDFRDGMTFISSKRFLEARQLFLRMMQQYPFDLYPYTNLSLACLGLRDFTAAWEALAQAWRIAPRDWTVLLCMVDYFYAIENYEQVEKCSTLIQEFGNLAPIGIAVLAISQWKMGKKTEAKATVSTILSQITKEMAATNNYYRDLLEIFKPEGTS